MTLGRDRPRSTVVAVATAALLLAACDDGQEGPPADEDRTAGATDVGSPDGSATDPPSRSGPGGAGGQEPDGPELPDVATIDPDEVDRDADPATIDGRVASAAAGLPDGWDVTVVADPTLGPYVLGLPPGSTVWRVGDDLEPLRQAVTDDAWWRYWERTLADAGAAAETSSLRAAVLVAADDDAELHVTISATPQADVPVDDPAAVAASFADAFRDQGLTVEEVTTADAGDREVGAVTLTTPDDEFDDGVPRRLHQWFHPEADGPVLWSVTCGGPTPTEATVDALCPDVLASFRTPPR